MVLLTAAPFARWQRAASPLACAGPRLETWIEKTIAAEGRRRAALEKEESAARGAEKLGQWATLVVSNLYRIDDDMKSIVVENWEDGGTPTELRFDPETTPKQQAEAAFKKARRMRRGSAVVAELIGQSDTRVHRLQGWRARALAIVQSDHQDEDDGEASDELRAVHAEILREAKRLQLKVDDGLRDLLEPRAGDVASGRGDGSLPRGSRGAKQAKALAPSSTKGWGGREFVSPNGIPILVGRNRAENEQLSLKISQTKPALAQDVWMHVRGSPGAHVLLALSRVQGHTASRSDLQPPPDECMQMAADLAAFYSEMRDENKVVVTFTSPKHITKPKGAYVLSPPLRSRVPPAYACGC